MSNNDDSSMIFGWLRIVIVLLLIFRGFFVEDRTGIHAAENVGFTDVQLRDAKHVVVGFRGCDVHDAAGFELTAKNALEKPAHLIVCCGWPFKGCTVRTP